MLKCPYCKDACLYVSDGDYYSGYESRGYRISCNCGHAWKTVPWCNTKEEAIKIWDKHCIEMRH